MPGRNIQGQPYNTVFQYNSKSNLKQQIYTLKKRVKKGALGLLAQVSTPWTKPLKITHLKSSCVQVELGHKPNQTPTRLHIAQQNPLPRCYTFKTCGTRWIGGLVGTSTWMNDGGIKIEVADFFWKDACRGSSRLKS